MSATNYVSIGRWSQCAHCRAVFEYSAGHFCGAPWQEPAYDMPPEWVTEIREAAEIARARAEPDGNDWPTISAKHGIPSPETSE